MEQLSLSVSVATVPAVLGVKSLSNTKRKKGGCPVGKWPRTLIGKIGLGTRRTGDEARQYLLTGVCTLKSAYDTSAHRIFCSSNVWHFLRHDTAAAVVSLI